MSWQPLADGLEAHLKLTRSHVFTLDVALNIRPGTTTALLGPNGSGKTTVVEAIAGILSLDAGGIALGDRLLDAPDRGVFVQPEDRRLGVVFQDQLLFPHLSVSRNVAFSLESLGTASNRVEADVRQWLHKLEIGDLADRMPASLSGGQAQRVALARALISAPDMLLLDEPLAAVDVGGRVQLRRTVAEHLFEFEGPRLLITHDPTEAFVLADNIVIVEDGAVTQTGSAEEIRLTPKTAYVADLAGSNLVVGHAHDGVVAAEGHDLHIADTAIEGPVFATVHPRAIALHIEEPEGSPRNSWKTSVTLVENIGDRVRLNVGSPLPLTVEITPGALAALSLKAGSSVWVSIKATEIGVEPS